MSTAKATNPPPTETVTKNDSEVAVELNEIAVFVRVVQTGSFTKAAQSLGSPKSTVSAKIQSLERRLGVTLLHRTTRQLHPTDEGEAFFRTCAEALSMVEAAEAIAASGQKTPSGRITVTGPVDLGRFFADFLRTFLERHKSISVDLVLTNRYVDLISEGVDVAIRAGHLKDSSLIAKRVVMNHRALYASPAYLKNAGEPRSPQDLAQHDCLRFGSPPVDEWHLVNRGRSVKVKVKGKVTVDDLSALRELTAQGHGIALIPSFSCREDLNEGRIVPVLADWKTEAAPLGVVYPTQRYQHPKVRVFVEEVASALKTFFTG